MDISEIKLQPGLFRHRIYEYRPYVYQCVPVRKADTRILLRKKFENKYRSDITIRGHSTTKAAA